MNFYSDGVDKNFLVEIYKYLKMENYFLCVAIKPNCNRCKLGCSLFLNK